MARARSLTAPLPASSSSGDCAQPGSWSLSRNFFPGWTRRRSSISWLIIVLVPLLSSSGCRTTLRWEDAQGIGCHAPAGHVQVQPAPAQVVAVPVVDGRAELILKPPLPIPEIVERQPNIPLALIGCVVHRHQQARAAL